MKFEIVTIFPDFFRGPLEHGIVRRAREAGLIEIRVHDLRAFTHDRHRTVDDRPFGGGEGMVLKPEPIFECLETLGLASREARLHGKAPESVVLTSAQGQLFGQPLAAELAGLDRLVLICGRYEGIDERVGDYIADREVSIGDYVLSGGELAAAIIVDAVTRLLPGALGNEASAWQESFSPLGRRDQRESLNLEKDPHLPKSGRCGAPSAEGLNDEGLDGTSLKGTSVPDSTCASGGLLDYPHYTRPADFRGMPVPEVLLGGNHDEIRRWRRSKALEKTLRNRPELLDRVALSKEDRVLLAKMAATAGAACSLRDPGERSDSENGPRRGLRRGAAVLDQNEGPCGLDKNRKE
jgi:tRNA (guanine37-N1)-methyltransferase